jgi:hypothetical protein
MQVKTYWAGQANGIPKAFAALDAQVEEDLGTKVTIHSVTDTPHGTTATPGPAEHFGISRVVVFSYPSRTP